METKILQIITPPANLWVGLGPREGYVDLAPVMALALVEEKQEDGRVFTDVRPMILHKRSRELDFVKGHPDHFRGYRFLDEVDADWNDADA